jgi:hypothetical protein
MIPVWRAEFWSQHLTELVVAARIALPVAVLWSFIQTAVSGTVTALAFSPVLLGLSVAMIGLDTATGCYKALRSDDVIFSSGVFGRVIDKILKYVVLIVAFAAIASAGEKAELPSLVFSWVRDFSYLVIIVREGGSAVENVWGQPLGALIEQFRETVGDVTK